MRNDSRASRQRLVLGALAILAAATAAVAGCGTPSTVAEHWRDPGWSGPAIKNLLVMVVRKDPVRRRQWEDAFTEALKKRGVSATPSYRAFPDSVPSEDALQQAMKDSAFEGILLSRNTGIKQSQSEIPPSTASVSAGVHWSTFYGTYITAYNTVYVPGYRENDRIVTNEITIWDARKDGQMVWSASTATENPTDANALRREVTNLIVPALKKDGIVP
jgi:hypothetical protein